MLNREWDAENNETLLYVFIPSKIATLIPQFAEEDLLYAELRLWCLNLQLKTCPWTEHSAATAAAAADDDDEYHAVTL